MTQAIKNQEAIADIQRRMASGELSYDQAKAEAQPIIDGINAKAAEIAKKYNLRAKKISFA
jgi:hypothetical protein